MKARACTKPCLPTTTNPCQPPPAHHMYWIGFCLIDFFTTRSISFLFDRFLYNGIDFCLIWSISVLRDRFLSYLIDFFTTGSISFWFDRFLYYGIHLFLIWYISSRRERRLSDLIDSLLRILSLSYLIHFFTMGSISTNEIEFLITESTFELQNRFLYHRVNFCTTGPICVLQYRFVYYRVELIQDRFLYYGIDVFTTGSISLHSDPGQEWITWARGGS